MTIKSASLVLTCPVTCNSLALARVRDEDDDMISSARTQGKTINCLHIIWYLKHAKWNLQTFSLVTLLLISSCRIRYDVRHNAWNLHDKFVSPEASTRRFRAYYKHIQTEASDWNRFDNAVNIDFSDPRGIYYALSKFYLSLAAFKIFRSVSVFLNGNPFLF